VIADGSGSERRFQPDRRGGFFDQPGDHGMLIAGPGGTFTLHELNGLVTAFRADGKIDYVQDTNNNRITAGYTGDLLTSLTHSSGQTLQFAYNAGRIIRVTDPVGRATTYTYDATNEHLVTVTTFDSRMTTYTYSLGAGAASDHALASIASPGGTHDFFTYDAQGRLKETRRDGGSQDIVYTYGPAGTVATTDAMGGTTTYSIDHRGLVVKVDDPLHRDTLLSYDENLNLTQVTDPGGQFYHYRYDAGMLIGSTDPLGHTNSFTYAGPFGRQASVTDANGNLTQYGYDANGNPISTTYADGSIERLTYDALGNPTTLTNRRDHVTQYAYDTSGRLLSKTFADGSQVTYHYDPRGNLTSTTDTQGTTTLTYDANDQLMQIAYPGGRFLHYTYDAAGRRTQMVDQDGFTVNYTYDAVGMLARLTDSTGKAIITYTYDAVGRLRREDKGNGTFTTYEYDLAGELMHLVNHAPDGSVSSRFDYTYDNLGQRATMTTLDGQWTYTYDDIGQLMHAVFVSNNPAAAPNQDLQYSYDAAGNRTQTIINGATTMYVSNNLNQYTTIGTSHLHYDADGNLISQTDGSGTSTYTYNDESRLTGGVIPDGSRWSYQYDAIGNRISTTFNGQQTNYLVDPVGLGSVVGQYNASGGLVAHYTQGLGLISRIDSTGAAAYYDFDGIGSTAGLSGPAGTYINHYSYLPFGEQFTSSVTVANPFTYIGQLGVMQDGNGLAFMRARSYTSANGRFISVDPLRILLPNWYAYAGNNPLSLIDPLGLESGGTEEECPPGLGFKQRQDILTNPINTSGEIGGDPQRAGEVMQRCMNGIKHDLHDVGDGMAPIPVGPPIPNPIGQPTPGTGIWSARKVIRKLLGPGGGGGGCSCTHVPSPAPVPQPPAGPPVPPTKPGSGGQSRPVSSFDPNHKIGPAGFGPAGFVAPAGTFSYRIDFENEAAATAPAQVVTVTDPLDPNLDWSTFLLTEVGFGDTNIQIPADSQHFQTTVPMTFNGQTLQVQIELGLNALTGRVTATFQSINPRTQLPPDVLTGFLPPENGTGRGMGYFSYTVSPKANLPTGTQIRNVASITFDANLPITTDQVDPHDPSKGIDPAKQDLNTIDAGPPTSSVNPLPAASRPSFTVTWSGADDSGGSGIASFDVFVSDNEGPFTPFQQSTTQTTATFAGKAGHTYGFYSVATDNVGHHQAIPAGAQATTSIPNLSRNGQFVAQAYQDLLGRPVDDGGLAFWTTQLDQGAPRAAVASALDHSAEYFATIIRPAYQQFLGRPPDDGGLAYWINQMAQGLTDEQLQAAFIGSPEFYNHSGGTDKAWVDAMYQNLLGRAPDPGGENYWIGQLAAGAGRGAVAYGFAASLERETTRVQEDYQKYLGRKGSDADVSFWVNLFKQSVTNEDVITGFVASAEYFNEHTGP
jgi:RHS repeat-associated protein